jgi:misacylated tRNA(Ala) deacylase
VYDEFGGRTVGNQIHADYSRIDFHPVSFTADDMKRLEEMTNEIIAGNIDVVVANELRTDLEARVDAQRCNLDLLPESVTDLRVLTIGKYDICPCAGTHVRNTSEVGRVKIIKKDNKGKQRQRIVYELV